jgi:hypothetical protein
MRLTLFHTRPAALLGILLLNACASRPINPPFYRQYREQYAITADELRTLQFYISYEVLAHAMDGSPDVTPEGVVIVAARTPGLVREVGPDWLRVAFTKGGEDVLFRARNDRANAVYGLATITESGKIALVSELPEPVLTQGERRYRILKGADASLIVSQKDLGRLIERRPRPAGLERESTR